MGRCDQVWSFGGAGAEAPVKIKAIEPNTRGSAGLSQTRAI